MVYNFEPYVIKHVLINFSLSKCILHRSVISYNETSSEMYSKIKCVKTVE